MSSDISVERFSTIADFELLAAGHSYQVAQVASHFLVLREAADIPPGEAELIIRVEGEELRRRIVLPAGASISSDWVNIERR
jgi:hypothetical protein